MRGKLYRKLVGTAARRASRDAFFLAAALEAYRLSHSFDEDQLAAFMDCPRDTLPRLGLCRRPDTLSSTFKEEVERIAAHAGVSPLPLGQLLREADVIFALQGGRGEIAIEASGLLIAARDAEGKQELGTDVPTDTNGESQETQE